MALLGLLLLTLIYLRGAQGAQINGTGPPCRRL